MPEYDAGLEERYCSHCGHSVVPLNKPHVERPCATCGRKFYVIELGKDGKGIKVRKGDKFTIPAASIRMSLDPKISNQFYRPGLLWFVQMLIAARQPKSVAELDSLLDYYIELGEGHLRKSPILEGLDIDSEEDGEEIWNRLSDDKSKQEFFAGLMSAMARSVKESISNINAESPVDAHKIALHMYYATLAHSLLTVKDKHFEEILWQGYQAYKFLTKVDDASAQTPAEVQALKKLQTLFEKQDEAVLHIWLTDGRPIGPRLGIEGIPEETLRAQCEYYHDQFERRRREERQAKEDEHEGRELKIKYVGVGAVAATAFISVIGLILRIVGIL
jgi:hypothetical protein